jgi:hypothetical protein
MLCPYCDAELSDVDELNVHALRCHPDKTELVQFRENVVSRLWDTAVQLTRITYGLKPSDDKEHTLATFKYFLRELIKSEAA